MNKLRERYKESLKRFAFFRKCPKNILNIQKIVARLKKIVSTPHGRVLIDFSIITLLAVIIFRNWLFTSEWPAGGDIFGWISRKYLFGKDLRWLYLWRPYSFGFPEIINFMDFLLMLINFICIDAFLTIKIFVFALFLTAAFSSYAFAYDYTKRNFAAFGAAIVYVFNPWFFSQLTEGHVDIIFSYALAPLVFLLVDKAFKGNGTKTLLLLAIALSVFVTGFHPEFIVIYGFFLILFIIFLFLHEIHLHGCRYALKKFLKKLVLITAITFMLTLFWALPIMFGSHPPYYSTQYKYYIEETYGLSYQNFYDAFTLGFIEKGGYDLLITNASEISLPGFPIIATFFVVFFAAYCTIFIRKDLYTTFFAFSMIISVLLSMGPYSPLKEIITWAWFNIPYFAVFRAMDRWISMTAFSHSFLVSAFFGLALNYVQEMKKNKKLKINIDINRKAEYDFTFLYSIKRTLCKASIVLMALILMSCFFSTYFFFKQGLQTFTPSETYLESLKYVGEQLGDYRIITVSKSYNEWMGYPSALTDFSSCGMLTSVGWYHDMGYDSSFIHDKPTLQDGGWSLASRAFVDRARFKLAREELTDDLLKIFQTFNFRYVVIPDYASESMRTFFTNQTEAEVCYDNDGSLILENNYYAPRIFGSYQKVLVVGGLESFSTLSDIPSFNLTSTPLLFANQLNKSNLEAALCESEYIVFVNSDILELVMLFLKDDSIMIKAADYAAPSLDASKFWIKSAYWRYIGVPMLNYETLSTCGANSIKIPFEVKSNDTYEIWVKVGFAPNRGNLTICLNNEFVTAIVPEGKNLEGLKWVNITQVNLSEGKYTLTFKNDGNGFNDVEAIAVVRRSVFQNSFNNVVNYLKNYNGTILYVKEGESTSAESWISQTIEYEGQVICNEHGPNIATLANASASSIESGLMGIDPSKAVDGSLNTRWSSGKGMPQWLELDWADSHEIAAMEIYFETALARRYTIETWDGEKWEPQVTDENYNNEQCRIINFSSPIRTNKLRIYVTEVTEFNSVSIWEIRVYSPAQEPVWTVKFELPTDGKYNFAIRLATGPDFGSVKVATENTTFPPFICVNSSKAFTWYEETVPMEFGVCVINVTGIGKTAIDKAVLYLRTFRDNVSIDTVFNSDVAQPQVSYVRVNPCEYIIHVNSTEPFILIFSDSYHPLWKAYLEGNEISPIITYFFVNGFFINKTGQFDITLQFKGQIYADIGIKVSATSFVIILTILLTPSKAFRKLRKI
jgi:hypothetical protein